MVETAICNGRENNIYSSDKNVYKIVNGRDRCIKDLKYSVKWNVVMIWQNMIMINREGWKGTECYKTRCVVGLLFQEHERAM